ncbi:MAG: pyridoxamine 5'-phosphate oxidase [Chitinophagaceae bacterium]|nr:pyridoxamine 5'-phosphate oxidase [Chitinophagaceae bacterium]MBK9533086.1 pyridoxamine 5'-phosphate oxidase [Chitinophagaceae bacterium]HQW94007.1 pyridoxamine 5'-phosphate oxidase [Ferruginibacter sp.]
MSYNIADIRKDYQMQSLLETDVAQDPFDQFANWWDDAMKSELDEINAMTLATASATGMPAARIVLLKSFSADGFVFFTNYNSQKGIELQENPFASLVFFWKELERQVRISGRVEKVSAAESDAYFHSRPEGSRIGAWASPQSSVIASREVIETNITMIEQQFTEGEISRPPHWGGYVVIPEVIEFWQGRPSRLHDRIQYSKMAAGSWKVERLAP